MASSPKPLILLTNDDGIYAAGLQALAEGMKDLGELVVCAPDTERSGASQAITLHSHLRATEVRQGWWCINGTPVDCVYLAALHLCSRLPSLVISGINAGYNLGSDVFYSGTVGGAAEGHRRGAHAIAVSVDRLADPNVAVPVVRQIARQLLRTSHPPRLVNLNFPTTAVAPDEEGRAVAPEAAHDLAQRVGAQLPVRLTRLGRRTYLDRVEQRHDLHGRPYYWIGGPPREESMREGDDTWAVTHGFVSVTPLELDITAPDLARFEGLLEPFAESCDDP